MPRVFGEVTKLKAAEGTVQVVSKAVYAFVVSV